MKKTIPLLLASAFLLTACSNPAAVVNAIKNATGSTTATGSSSTSTKSWPSSVTQISTKANDTVSVSDSLDNGQTLSDLSWAANSSVACFPATQNTKFRGKHMFYAASLPPHSVMTITVKPKNADSDLSLYAYQIGTTRFDLVPNLSSAVSCEADYKWDYPKAGKTQGSERSVKLNATTNPYNVLIGVSGPAAASGEFTLEVKLEQ